MNGFDFKKLIPHAVAVALFAIISAVYFVPEIEGKRIAQSDIAQFKGMSKEIVDHREANDGEEALWTNSMFGGMPAYQISVKHPEPVIGPIDKFLKLGSKGGLGKFFLYMIGFYILMMSLKLDYRIAIFGALAYGLSTYLIIILEVGHNSKAVALGYAPAVLAGFIMLFRNKQYLWGTVVTALFLGLQIKGNHPQVTYYLLISMVCIGAFYLADAFKKGTLPSLAKSLGLFVLASGIAVGLSAPRLMSTLEYAPWSTRGATELSPLPGEDKGSGLDINYATSWSYGKMESFTFLVPNFVGGNSEAIGAYDSAMDEVDPRNARIVSQLSTYWGDQPGTSGPVYFGALIMLLALIGFWYLKGPLKWGLLVSAILMIMLSWGKNLMPFTEFFFDYVPGYNKFRAVSMALVVPGIIFPLMAMLGLREIITRREEMAREMKGLYTVGGTVFGLLLLMLIAPSLFSDFYGENDFQVFTDLLKRYQIPQPQIDAALADLPIARMAVFKADVLRTFFIVLVSLGLIWAFIKEKVNMSTLVIALALISFLDLWTVGKRYLNAENFISSRIMEKPFPMTDADKQILKDKDPYFRVYNSTLRIDQDAQTSYYHKSIGGYHAAKPGKYEELIYRQLVNQNFEILNMLNTKYIIQQNPQTGKMMAIQNPDAAGNAWFVNRVEIVEDADAEMAALDDIRVKEYAVMDARYKDQLSTTTWSSDSTASIRLTSYAANKLVFESNRSSDGFAVFSDTYYQPGWNSYIDNDAVDHLRVNYVLRGMEIPAGKHEIVFEFKPEVIAKGNTIAYASSALLLLLIVGVVIWEFRKSQEPKD
jgi:hypothetical protein